MKLNIIHSKCTARSKAIFVNASHTVLKLYITLCTARSTAVFPKYIAYYIGTPKAKK